MALSQFGASYNGGPLKPWVSMENHLKGENLHFKKPTVGSCIFAKITVDACCVRSTVGPASRCAMFEGIENRTSLKPLVDAETASKQSTATCLHQILTSSCGKHRCSRSFIMGLADCLLFLFARHHGSGILPCFSSDAHPSWLVVNSQYISNTYMTGDIPYGTTVSSGFYPPPTGLKCQPRIDSCLLQTVVKQSINITCIQ